MVLPLIFVKDQLTIFIWVCFWAFYFVLLIYFYILLPIPQCLDYCSFIVIWKSGSVSPSTLFFFSSVMARDAWVAQSVKHLPSAQVMIPGSWDQVAHQAPCSMGSLLLSLPAPSSAYSLSLSLTNK